MAVATWSSSAALVKAVVLPLILVVLAMSAGASSTEDGTAVAESGGRFSETPVGRKLLGSILGLCGGGSAPDYNCKNLLPFAKKPTCCTILVIPTCFDVGGSDILKCGSCTNKCKFGEVCCSGVCANLLTDKNNCGGCGRTCRGTCTLGFCKY